LLGIAIRNLAFEPIESRLSSTAVEDLYLDEALEDVADIE
jgi:hypothetical protein